MMLNDPRYDAETWLRDRVAPMQRVAGVGHETLLIDIYVRKDVTAVGQ